MSRQYLYLKRQPLISIAQIAISIVQGLFSLCVFYKISEYSFKGIVGDITLIHEDFVAIKNTTGSIFFLAANVFVGLIYGAIMSFQLERAVLLKELSSKFYGLPAFFVSKNLFEIPLMFIYPLFTLLIVYWGAPYGTLKGDSETFWKYYLVLFFVCQTSIGYGYMVSAACKNQVDSSLLSNAVNLPAIFFGGLFANSKTIVKGVGWIQYLSPIRFAFEAMLTAEYEKTPLKFVLNEFSFTLGYWNCIYGLVTLSVVTRIFSLWILMKNVKYVQ